MNESTIQLGSVSLTPMGTGTWAWGDFLVWGYRPRNDTEFKAAYDASIEAGVTLFDTAELYGFGRSEKLIGKFLRQNTTTPIIATKFMPLPWRRRQASVVHALRRSLKRLDLPSIDLYQIHWTSTPHLMDVYAQGLAEAVKLGLTKHVGVSNYSADQMRRTYEILADQGIKLASNQVEYSLISRAPERNGLLAACQELGVTLIAYSPLGMGLLTGKFTPENPPTGVRKAWFGKDYLRALQPLINVLREIGIAHERTPAQVALNWTICKGTLPIPGAKNTRQLQENVKALGWRLTPEEVNALDVVSEPVQKPSI